MIDPQQLSFLDYGLIALVALGLPVLSIWDHKRFERKLEIDNGGALRSMYLSGMGMLWLPTMLIIGHWLYAGRNLADMGLSIAPTIAGGIGLAVALLAAAQLTAQVFQVRRSADAAEQVLKELRRTPALEKILPKTPADYALFKGLSVTAGITEEIMFRGYLIWGFSFWMESWLAALLALAAFVLAHLYQDSKEALVKVALTGGALTLLYMLSGSLIPAIILHAVIDLTSGAACWHARQKKPETA